MNPPEIATARFRAYRLFGRLYREGLTSETYKEARGIPDLAGSIPDSIDFDEAAASHQQIFGFNVFPYASVYLDIPVRLGGDVTQVVEQLYRQDHFFPDLSSESADHISCEMDYLAHLSRLEAGTGEQWAEQDRMRIHRRMRSFLRGHLLWWLPVYVLAVKRQEERFYENLASLTLDLVFDHWHSINEAGKSDSYTLPEVTSILDDEKTGLREIAAYLTTPAWSGIYLSRREINRIARSENVPHGFGDRQTILTNLFRSSAEYDRIGSVIESLRVFVEEWKSEFEELFHKDLRGLDEIRGAWLGRLEKTSMTLQKILHAIPFSP